MVGARSFVLRVVCLPPRHLVLRELALSHDAPRVKKRPAQPTRIICPPPMEWHALPVLLKKHRFNSLIAVKFHNGLQTNGNMGCTLSSLCMESGCALGVEMDIVYLARK